MQYEYTVVELAISIHILEKWSIGIGIDQRKQYYRTSCRLNTAGD